MRLNRRCVSRCVVCGVPIRSRASEPRLQRCACGVREGSRGVRRAGRGDAARAATHTHTHTQRPTVGTTIAHTALHSGNARPPHRTTCVTPPLAVPHGERSILRSAVAGRSEHSGGQPRPPRSHTRVSHAARRDRASAESCRNRVAALQRPDTYSIATSCVNTRTAQIGYMNRLNKIRHGGMTKLHAQDRNRCGNRIRERSHSSKRASHC